MTARDEGDGFAEALRGLGGQRPCVGQAMLLEVRIAECVHRPEGLPSELLRRVPFGTALAPEIRSLSGVSSLPCGMCRAISLWPLQSLDLEALEEEELDEFCAALPAVRGLRSLSIRNFCRDEPTAERFAPILRALPPSCERLEVSHVLPLSRAFTGMPGQVRSLGTVVLMSEVFYHSRVVGMSLRHFEHAFPRLPGIREVRMVLGPGHYEEPSWPRGPLVGKRIADALLEKFPGLEALAAEVRVESESDPPVVGLARSLAARGVGCSVAELRPASGRPAARLAVRDAAQALLAEGIDVEVVLGSSTELAP